MKNILVAGGLDYLLVRNNMSILNSEFKNKNILFDYRVVDCAVLYALRMQDTDKLIYSTSSSEEWDGNKWTKPNLTGLDMIKFIKGTADEDLKSKLLIDLEMYSTSEKEMNIINEKYNSLPVWLTVSQALFSEENVLLKAEYDLAIKSGLIKGYSRTFDENGIAQPLKQFILSK